MMRMNRQFDVMVGFRNIFCGLSRIAGYELFLRGFGGVKCLMKLAVVVMMSGRGQRTCHSCTIL